MSKGKKVRRKVGQATRQAKRNSQSVLQPCCGAPKNGHYGDCPTRARKS